MKSKHQHVHNRIMRERLEKGEAKDVSECPLVTVEGVQVYDVTNLYEKERPDSEEQFDYCDAKEQRWVFSIGMDPYSGKIYASMTNMFYQNPPYKCLFLR